MADDSTSTPFILNRADGTSRTFKKCSPADRLTFRATFRHFRKVWLAESLEVLGIKGDEAVERMNKLDRARLFESDVLQWVMEPEGQYTAILLSLQKDNPKATTDDVHALELDPDGRLAVAIGVFNLTLTAEGKDEKKSPLPGGTEGGATTPASSGDSPAVPTP